MLSLHGKHFTRVLNFLARVQHGICPSLTMLKNETVHLGASNHVRDYMYVDDHVEAYMRAIEMGIESEVLNVSPGNRVTNLQLAEEIQKITGYEGKIVQNAYPPGYPIRPPQ